MSIIISLFLDELIVMSTINGKGIMTKEHWQKGTTAS